MPITILLCKDEKAKEEAERMFSLKNKIDYCFFKHEEAVKCLQVEKDNFLIILVDLRMPKDEGSVFLREAKEIVKNGEIIGTYFTEMEYF